MKKEDLTMLTDENPQIYPIQNNLQPQKVELEWLLEKTVYIRVADFIRNYLTEGYVLEPTIQKFRFMQNYEFELLNIQTGYREPSNLFVYVSFPKLLEETLPSTVKEKSIWVDISQQFNQNLLDRIDGGTKAITLMTPRQKEMYKDSQKVFDALADELLDGLLGELSEKFTPELKEKLREWLLVLTVRVNDAIEL